MSTGYKKVKKLGNHKSACDYSCFNGKQVLERVHVKVWTSITKRQE